MLRSPFSRLAILVAVMIGAGLAAPATASAETRIRLVFLNLHNKLPIPSWADRREWDMGLDARGRWWFSDNDEIDKALSGAGAPPALAAIHQMLIDDETLQRAFKALAQIGKHEQVYFLLVDDRTFLPSSRIWPHASWKQGNLMDLANAGLEERPEFSFGDFRGMIEASQVRKARYVKIGEVQAAADLATGADYLKGVLVHEFAHTQDGSSRERGSYGLDGTHFYDEIQTGPRGAWLEGFANFCGLAFSKDLRGYVQAPATRANGFRIESTTQSGQYTRASFGQLTPAQLMSSEAVVAMILLKLAEYANPGNGGDKASTREGILKILEAVALSNDSGRDLPWLFRTYLRMDAMGGANEEALFHRFLRSAVVLDVYTGFQFSDAELFGYYQNLRLLAHGTFTHQSLDRVGGEAPKALRFLAAYLGPSSGLRHRARLMYYEHFGATYSGRASDHVPFMPQAALDMAFDFLISHVEADFRAWEDGTFNPGEDAAGYTTDRTDADDLEAGNPWEDINR